MSWGIERALEWCPFEKWSRSIYPHLSSFNLLHLWHSSSQKVCGVLGHSATKGCSRCFLSFPTSAFGEKPDYSNLDQSERRARELEEHRKLASDYSKCQTLSAQKIIEEVFVIRYSILLELPYWNPIQMCVVDPTHNSLLGSAKHITEIWKSKSILNSKDLDTIQNQVNIFVCPADEGRIPSKLASGLSDMTADQWKNWVLLFSCSEGCFTLKRL